MKKAIKAIGLALLLSQTPINKAIALEDKIEETSKTPYNTLLNEIKSKRKEFSNRYNAKNNEVLNEAKNYLNSKSSEVIEYWKGTPWNYHGSTNKPKEGSIACGYFVSTVLKDLDFNLNRISLGDQPSLYIIKNLVEKKDIKKINNLNELNNFEDGLYIIGLDRHTGYISKNKEDIQFCNSSFEFPKQVLCEKALDSDILKNSKYKVLGKLFEKDLVKKWLSRKFIDLKYDYFKN